MRRFSSSRVCFSYPNLSSTHINNIIARNHATNILSHPGGISRQLELAEPPAPRLPLFLEARATTQAAYRDLRVAHVRGPPSQTGGTDSDIDVLCDTGFLPAPQLNLTTYSAPSRVSDPADWDEDLKIGRTLETGPEIVFAPRVKLRPPRVSFLVECGPIERGLDNSGLRSSTHSASRPGPSSSPPAASCSSRRRAKNTPDNLETHM